MKIRNNNYTYPVLSNYNNDFVDSSFIVEYKQGFDESNRLYIDISIFLENTEIEKLILEKKALMCLHVECSNTSLRNSITLKNILHRYYIDDNLLSGSVDFNVLIYSNTELQSYTNKNFNSSVFGESFVVRNLKKGMILASSITQSIELTTEKDKLKDISSIIKVGVAKDIDDMSIDYEQDFILIKLPEQEYRMYNELSRMKYSSLVLTSVIYPALIYILETMKSPTNEDLQWYKVIRNRIESLNYEVKDIGESIMSYKLAQLILGKPLHNALNPMILEEY